MNIAIAGFGAEGRSNYAYFRRAFPDARIMIADEREQLEHVPKEAETLLGEQVFSHLDEFDMVVRTAGLAPRKIQTNGKIWSATNEFFAKCPATIISVTGTKGKGTTCSFIASILRAAGKTVHLVGNIGTPALDVLDSIQPDDIVVYELSSFQLWDLEKSPHIAVVLMIESDHLDVHEDFEEYIEAKANIAKNQLTTDRVVYFAENEWSKQVAETSVGQRLAYPDERFVHARGDRFYHQDTPICDTANVQLPGAHNIDNACAAISAVWPWVQDGAVIAEGLRGFDGLPHRLKLVAEVNGVKYYDDSIATTPGSAIAALRSFAQPKVIILGGSYKGSDYVEVVETVKETGARVLAIGQTGGRIYELCEQHGVLVEREEGGMAEIVHHAAQMADSGDIVILSPASASFDMFKSYSDRGEQFVQAVEELQ